MSLDTESKAFWDRWDVESELKRCEFSRTRKKPLHPVQVLEPAYGLAEDGNL
jgi:hypothetical protein